MKEGGRRKKKDALESAKRKKIVKIVSVTASPKLLLPVYERSKEEQLGFSDPRYTRCSAFVPHETLSFSARSYTRARRIIYKYNNNYISGVVARRRLPRRAIQCNNIIIHYVHNSYFRAEF